MGMVSVGPFFFFFFFFFNSCASNFFSNKFLTKLFSAT